jgi:Tol biopolymer transport system component
MKNVKQYKYDYRHAIFERDGQVYIYHEDSNSIEPVGDPSKAKSMPSLSPDHQKVAFTYLQANISHF